MSWTEVDDRVEAQLKAETYAEQREREYNTITPAPDAALVDKLQRASHLLSGSVDLLHADIDKGNEMIAALVEALRPFAALWQSAMADKPDSHPVWQLNEALITVGDIRAARAALASVEPPALFSIWQRFKDDTLGNGQWGLWACTYHVNLTDADARAKLAEIEADELERRERYPDTMAIYEIRPAIKGAN